MYKTKKRYPYGLVDFLNYLRFYPPGRKSVAFLLGVHLIFFFLYLYLNLHPRSQPVLYEEEDEDEDEEEATKKFFKSLHNNIVYTLDIYE